MHPAGGLLRDQVITLQGGVIRRDIIVALIALGGGAIAAANNSTGWTVGCGIVALLFVGGVVLAARLQKHPERHRKLAPLLRLYNCSLEQLSLQLEQELAANPPTGGQVRVTPSWLYGFANNDLTLVRIDQVAWAYKHTLTQYRNGVKEGQFHTLIVRPIYAPETSLEVSARSTEVEQLVRYIAQRAPWAWIGFDEQRKQMWATPDGRQKLVAAVMARRQGIGAA